MGRRSEWMIYVGILLVIAAILYPNGVNSQSNTACEDADELTFDGDDSDGGGSPILWPVTWVPGCTDRLKFSVKLEAADAVARIFLTKKPYARGSFVAPFYVINLGWNAGTDGPGSDADEEHSYIVMCTSDDTVPCRVPKVDHTTIIATDDTDNGDVTTNRYVGFFISMTENAINVGYEGGSVFMTLNTDGSSTNPTIDVLNPRDIRFVGVESHDGVDGMTFVQDSLWIFCTDDWQSLATANTVSISGTASSGTDCSGSACPLTVINDGDLGTCYTASGANPYVQIDLGEEMHVVGVTVYVAEAGNPVPLADSEVYVGSCLIGSVTTNIKCGTAITGAEITAGPVYRTCVENTYGRYVYVRKTTTNTLPICEVVVHGKPIAASDKTTIQWESATYSAMESPASTGDCNSASSITSMETLTLTRTGSASSFTCSTVDTIVVTETGATDPDDFGYTDAAVNFAAGEDTQTILVDIKSDCLYEGDHSVTFQLPAGPLGNGEVIGTTSLTTLTIVDDDPKYTFDASTASVWENDPNGKIPLTITRSGYITAVTTVYVTTADGTATTGSGDFTSLTGTSTPIVFGIGETTKTVDVYINNDNGNVDAVDEDFTVMLVPDNQGEATPYGTVTVTILNDDTVYEPCSPGIFYGPENTENIVVTICRRGKIDTAGCIDIASQPVSSLGATSATEGVDYDEYTRMTVNFAGYDAVETVNIPVTDDKMVEDDEIFLLPLTLPTVACDDIAPVVRTAVFADVAGLTGVARPQATLVIQNDDTTSSVSSPRNVFPESIRSVTVTFTRNEIDSTRESTIEIRVYGAMDPSTNVGTSFATETDGLDFMSAGTHFVTFPKDEITASHTIPIIDDSLIELDESFFVEIIDSDSEINNGAKITELIIQNNDAYFSLQRTEHRVQESVGQFHVSVQRGPLEVNGVLIPAYLDNNVDIEVVTNSEIENGATATANRDFIPVLDKTVTFSGTTRDAVQTCPITIVDDELVEGEEVFFVRISNPGVQVDPDRSQSNITIEDDDGRISCTIGGETIVTLDESHGSIIVTCTRDGIDNGDGDDQGLNRVANFVLTAVSQSAIEDEDFNTYRATLEFPAGESTITETIPNLLINDLAAENTESFRLQVTEADSEIDATTNGITINILDDDTARFRFEQPDYDVGESCQLLQVAIIRAGAGEEGTTIRITATDGTGGNGAVYPDDYTTRESTVYFLPNQQQQLVTINVNRDNINEGSESFTLSLSKLSGSGEIDTSAAIATVTIQDQSVTYSVQDSQITRSESSGTEAVYFVRTGDFCNTDEIFVSTRDISARARSDYISFTNRRVVFGSNSNIASVDLTILDDNVEEQTETFTVFIQENNVQVGTASATVTIQDDDGRVYFREDEYRVSEDRGSVTLTIDRAGNSFSQSTVRVQTATGTATAGSDYTILSNTFVNFDISDSSKTFSVQIADDNEYEEDETFSVIIVDTTDGVVGRPNEAIVTIVDDDEPSTGLSTGAIIGIAAGVGGGFLLILIIGGVIGISSFMQRPAPVRAPQPPVLYNAPPNYPPAGYGYGPNYGPPRSQRVAYYR